jgi:conjugal transfer pilus assembly protein TraW
MRGLVLLNKRNKYLFVMLFTLNALPAFSGDLGVVGKVYPIRERDALAEIEDRARKVDWQKTFSSIKPRKYRPKEAVSLPAANKGRTYLVDMTYTLEMDIPDDKGNILYPKGYSFNPLDYVRFGKTLVVINGDDRRQIEWFRESPYAERYDVMLLITDGVVFGLGEKLKRSVYYADARIVERFNIQAVPSIVKQKGRMMEVEEIRVQKSR